MTVGTKGECLARGTTAGSVASAVVLSVLLFALAAGCSTASTPSATTAASAAVAEVSPALGPAIGELDTDGLAVAAATLAFLKAREQALAPASDADALRAACDSETDLAERIVAFSRGYHATSPGLRFYRGSRESSLRKLVISGSTARVLAYAYRGGNVSSLHLITLRRTGEGWLVSRDQADEYDGYPAEDYLAKAGYPHPLAGARSFVLDRGRAMEFPPGLLTTLDAYLGTSWEEAEADPEAFRGLWTPDARLQTMPVGRLSEWTSEGRTLSIGPVRHVGPPALGFCEVVVTTAGKTMGNDGVVRSVRSSFVETFERQTDERWLLFEMPATVTQ